MALKSRLVQALLRSSTSLGTTQISPAFVPDDVDAFSYFFVGGVATRQFFPYAVNGCLSAFAGVGWQLMKRLFNVELQD